jgi:hypothetical protein
VIRITANHFCAGLVVENGVVVHAPPILRYMHGWATSRVYFYCMQKNWKYEQW